MIIYLLSGSYSASEIITYILIFLFAITVSFSVHEFMHAYVAHLLGDDTAKNLGRMTLNPAAHLDIMGTLLLLAVGLGWGKPVPVNTDRLTKLRSKRASVILVNLAGVFGNFMVAIVAAIIFSVLYFVSYMNGLSDVLFMFVQLMKYTIYFSLLLLAFNLIPIPPLDGFHVLEELLPYRVRSTEGYSKFIAYAPMVFLILIVVGSFSGNSIISMIIGWIEYPFSVVITLIENGVFSLLMNFV